MGQESEKADKWTRWRQEVRNRTEDGTGSSVHLQGKKRVIDDKEKPGSRQGSLRKEAKEGEQEWRLVQQEASIGQGKWMIKGNADSNRVDLVK